MNVTRSRDMGVTTSLHLYLRDIQGDALLTASEERELAGAIARGDEAARRRMIEANLRLVVKIARDYVGRGIPIDDLIGEGNLGLIRAAKEYDPRFGTRFSTYASYWIKQAIRHALINTTTTIRLPAHMVGLMTRWRRTERALGKELRRSPTFEEIATTMGLTAMQKMLVSRAHQARQLKLESGLSSDANRWSPEEAIDDGEHPGSRLEAEDERTMLIRRMSRLDERERTILALRYGLEGAVPLTLKEIGRQLGVTREWVRKIEMRAVRKLDDGSREEPAPDRRDDPRGLSRRVRSTTARPQAAAASR